MNPRDIVIIRLPDRPLDGCLAVVEEVRAWGVIAYVQTPGGGRAYVRLGPESCFPTGGSILPKAVSP